MTHATTPRRMRRSAGLCLVLAGALLPACRGERHDKPPRIFFNGGEDQPKYKAQAQSSFYKDGRTMREPVSGTVAFGRSSKVGWGADDAQKAAAAAAVVSDRGQLLAEDDAVYRGIGADGKYVPFIPVEVTEAMLRRGQERYNIYCTPCHSYTGNGLGLVGSQWSYALPNFHDEKYIPGPKGDPEKSLDGYIFHTIRNGVPNAPGVQPALKMPGYRNQVSERDAWAIVAYVRALQRGASMPLERVPAELRPELDRMKGAAPSKPPAAMGPGAPPAIAAADARTLPEEASR